MILNTIALPIIVIIILVYSSILHEIAHGYVAYRFGDPTAKIMGRLTLNPIKHIDPFMSILFPLILILSGTPIIFGGAKPVPIDPFNLKEKRKDFALISLAGPVTNILIATIGSIIVHALYPGMSFTAVLQKDIFGFILSQTIRLNLLLAVFNLIPIPPLDGSRVFALLLNDKQAEAYLSLERFGLFFIFLLLMFPVGQFSLMNIVGNILNFSVSLLGL